jgi:hypothetical protein
VLDEINPKVDLGVVLGVLVVRIRVLGDENNRADLGAV